MSPFDHSDLLRCSLNIVVNTYADQTWVDKNAHTMFCEKCHRATGPNPKKALSPALLAVAKKLLML